MLAGWCLGDAWSCSAWGVFRIYILCVWGKTSLYIYTPYNGLPKVSTWIYYIDCCTCVVVLSVKGKEKEKKREKKEKKNPVYLK